MINKLIYVAHPISGDVAANLLDIGRIMRSLNEAFPTYGLYAPYFGDCTYLDDSIPAQRTRGIENDTALIRTGVFDELWLTGDRISLWMTEEIKLFKALGKEVRDFTNKF